MVKESNGVIIRSFQQSDIDDLIALFRVSVRKIAAAHYSKDQCLAWAPDQIDRTIWIEKRSNKPTWVATCNSQIAGFTDLEPDGHIDMLYVHPDFQRQGVASALIKQVHETATRQYIKRLFTEASITVRPAFEKFGFTVIEQQTVHRNGQEFTNYRMEKLL
jgi:putative acetyltransferase